MYRNKRQIDTHGLPEWCPGNAKDVMSKKCPGDEQVIKRDTILITL